MNASELRIGNFIYRHFENGPGETEQCTVRDIFDASRAMHERSFKFSFSPIPLTEEWLLKFKFRKEEEHRYARGHCDYSYVLTARSHNGFKDGGYFMGIRYDDWDQDPVTIHNFAYVVNGVQYVHQLQNLYFALTGEELIFG